MRSRSTLFRPCGILFFALQSLTLAASAATLDTATGVTGTITISPSCAGATKPDEPCVMPFANAHIRLNRRPNSEHGHQRSGWQI